jgi:hypothetical protein
MPKIYEVNGQDVEFFTSGELADALDRQRQTIRKWEKEGTIPQAQYRSKTGRRLYTKEQVTAILSTVEKYGLKQGTAIPAEFKKEVFEAFAAASTPEKDEELEVQQA